jgi:hypothetical protein
MTKESFETPNFLDLHTQLSSETSTHPVYTKVTLQEAKALFSNEYSKTNMRI